MEKIKDMKKMVSTAMSMAKDPKLFLRGILENLSPLELNIKVHGIRPDNDGIERLWISIVMPKVELPDIPELEEPEETEEKKEDQ